MSKTEFKIPQSNSIKPNDNFNASLLMENNSQQFYLFAGNIHQYDLMITRKSLQIEPDELIEMIRTMLNYCSSFSMLGNQILIYADQVLFTINMNFSSTKTEQHECNVDAWFEHFCDFIKNHKDEKNKDSYSFSTRVLFNSNSSHAEINQLIQKLKRVDRRAETEKVDDKSYIHIVRTTSNGGLATMSKELQPADGEFGVEELYNDDFIDINERILHEIDQKSKGLVLLHGAPGTGKTSYVKYMIGQINKNVVYMPPMLAPSMAQPSFMSFLIDHCEDSVIVIEDAENVLKERESGGNDAVSNILNTTDGMLGDALNIQFVCTFNCDVNFIDKALFRPGRLIEQYKFEKLEREKAEKLLRKYYNNDEISASSDMTLGEIFNYKEIINPVENEKKQGFGFLNN